MSGNLQKLNVNLSNGNGIMKILINLFALFGVIVMLLYIAGILGIGDFKLTYGAHENTYFKCEWPGWKDSPQCKDYVSPKQPTKTAPQ